MVLQHGLLRAPMERARLRAGGWRALLRGGAAPPARPAPPRARALLRQVLHAHAHTPIHTRTHSYAHLTQTHMGSHVYDQALTLAMSTTFHHGCTRTQSVLLIRTPRTHILTRKNSHIYTVTVYVPVLFAVYSLVQVKSLSLICNQKIHRSSDCSW